jgi:CIC family chloride channel protein
VGAGIAALFRAPLAGAIFGAEIFYSSSDLEYEALLPSFAASTLSYTVFACFWGWDPLFTMPAEHFEKGLHLLPYFGLALVITFGARFYIAFFRWMESVFRRFQAPVWAKAATGGLAVGLIALVCPFVHGAGYGGPVTLLGAACGSVVTRWFRLDKRASRILMAAGLAAGIAALFRAPLAGAIFGAEIFYSSSDMEADTVMPSVVASVMSYTIFCCFYGWEPIFDMPPCAFANGLRLLPYLMLAFVVAFGARFYISVFRSTENWFSARTWPTWTRVAVGGLLTGLLGFVFPDILGSSYGLIQTAFLAGGDGTSGTYGTLTALGFLVFFFVKVVATSFTVGSGGSGGLFAPALACGGALGAATGLFFRHVLPTSVGIHPGAFALVGMAAFLASSIRVPLTSIVMVAEISGNHELLLPTMWACCIAFWLNNGWSLYRSQVHSRESSPLH